MANTPSEVFELNGLNKLQYRVVRGAKPGNKNYADSSKIQVVTEELYDSKEVKEYLLQASSESNLYEGTAVFTEDSTSVSASGDTSFSDLSEGDIIRPNGSKSNLIISSVSGDTLTLKSDYKGASGDLNFLAQKILVGNADYQHTDNSVALEQFEFDSQTSTWKLTDDGSFGSSKSTSSAPSLMEDGISLSWKSDEDESTPDLQVLGSINDKKLNTVASDSSSVPLTPVPYPADHSTLVVSRKLPEDSEFSDLAYGENYAISYNGEPLFKYPYPPLQDRASASLMFLDTFEHSQEIGTGFNGQINLLKEDGTSVGNLMPTIDHLGETIQGTVVSVGGEQKNEDEEYLLNRLGGVITFIGNNVAEEPVQTVLYSNNLLQSGITVSMGSGSLDNPDFSDAKELSLGTDYFLNLSNGTVLFSEGLSSDQVVKFEYLVEGQPLQEIKESSITSRGEAVSDLRTDRFPIVQGTVSLSRRGKGGYASLIEGTDYEISYMTGAITLLKDIEIEGGFFIEYTPASRVTMLLEASESEDYPFEMKIVDDPVFVVSGDQYAIKTANNRVFIPEVIENDKGEEETIYNFPITLENIEYIKTIARKDASGNILPGEELSLENAKILESGKITVLDPNTNTVTVKDRQVLLASYKFGGSALPYSPIITIQHFNAEGSNSILVEDRDLTGEIPVNGVIRMVSRDSSDVLLFLIKRVELVNGINTKITTYGAFPGDIRDASITISDDSLDLLDKEYTALPYGKANPSILIVGDITKDLSVGKALVMGDGKVHQVVGFSLVGDSSGSEALTAISISPATKKAASLLSSDRTGIKISTKPVYLEGDNAITTELPVLGTPIPAIKIKLSDSLSARDDVSASVYIDKQKILISKTEGTKLYEYNIDRSSFSTVQEVVAEIESFPKDSEDKSFQVEWLLPDDSELYASLIKVTTNEDPVSQPMPYNLKVNTHLLRKRQGEEQYTLLTQGAAQGYGDYSIVNGFLVLEEPIQKYDRFKVTYQGLNTLKDFIGEEIDVSSKYFVDAKKGTELKVSKTYLQPDQWYIQSMAEGDFVTSVVDPFIKERDKLRKGASPQGVENNLPADQGNAEGGVQDNYFLLRDEQIKLSIYRRVYKYYADRAALFSKEEKSIKGALMGNSDPFADESDPRYNLVSQRDIDHHATFATSRMMPISWDKPELKVDSRFEKAYLSYGEANFFNYEGKGVVLGDNPEWESRNLLAGDEIRIYGTDVWYTIESIDNDNTITLEQEIADLDSPTVILQSGIYMQVYFDGLVDDIFGNPSFKPMNPTGYQYEVRRLFRPKFPVEDDRGFLGSQASGKKDGPFGFSAGSRSISNIFVIEWTENEGATWNPIEMDLTDAGPSFSIESVRSLIKANEDFSNNFKIDIEDRYDSEISSEETAKASWPIVPTSLNQYPGVRKSLVIRANSKSMWFRFPEPIQVVEILGEKYEFKKDASRILGFARGWTDETGAPQGTWFFPSSVPFNADNYTAIEQSDRATQIILLDDMMAVDNKLGRSAEYYLARWLEITGQLSQDILLTQSLIEQAKLQAELITTEESASPAIEVSYAEANEAIVEYDRVLETNLVSNAHNTAAEELANNSFDEYTWSLELAVNTRDSLESQEGEFITLTCTKPESEDPRILIGSGSSSSTVVVDGASRTVFPTYINNENYVGEEFNPIIGATWVDTVDSTTAFSIRSNETLSYQVSVSNSAILTLSQVDGADSYEYELSLETYRTVDLLVDAINNGPAAERFSAEVIEGKGATSTDLMKPSTYTSVVKVTPEFTPKEYTPTNSYSLSIGRSLISVLADLSGPASSSYEYEVTDEAVIFYTDTSTDTLLFSTYPTVQNLTDAINALPSWSATIFSEASPSLPYGILRKVSRTDVVIGVALRQGILGDIQFYQISDYNLNEFLSVINNRQETLQVNRDFYNSRELQIQQSFSYEGEKLVDNQNLWLNRIVHREDGPAAIINTLKKRLEEEAEEE